MSAYKLSSGEIPNLIPSPIPAASSSVLVSVALPLPTPRLFTYRVPDEMLGEMAGKGAGKANSEADREADSKAANIALRPMLQVGMRVLVPFGKRILTGVVVDVHFPEAPKAAVVLDHTAQIRDVLELLDTVPAFTAQMLAFTRWIAEYYCASWGETLKSALPQGMSVESVVRVSAVKQPTPEILATMERHAPRRAALLRLLVQLLAQQRGEVSVGHLETLMSGANSSSTGSSKNAPSHIGAQLEALEELGYIERHRTLTKEAKPKMQKAVAVAPELLRDDAVLKAVLNELDATAPKQARLLSSVWIHQMRTHQVRTHQVQSEVRPFSQTFSPEAEANAEAAEPVVVPLLARDALREAQVSDGILRALVQKKYLVEYQTEVLRGTETDTQQGYSLIQRDETALTLTLEQQHAVDKIAEPLQRGVYKAFLLHGVTGSGKTLVYIQAIRDALAGGKSALLLVPEIALTPQLIERFRAVFGEAIGVMHSHKSTGERFDAWRTARSGETRLIIGARSAIFAPLQNLGLIIVDEEHEPSYKQDDPAPRYNARDCAIVRGTMERAVVVLGSATPSLESTFNAHLGKYHLLEITERADGAKLPTIRVVDTVEARKRRQMQGSFSNDLLAAIAQRIEKKEGVILFQNRRGFASRLECMDCGAIPMCPNCAVALTYHKHREQLRCHYCGFSRTADAGHRACTTCGSLALKEIGAGTQRIEEELAELLKQNLSKQETSKQDAAKQEPSRPVVIQRMDLDTTAQKGSHKRMLQDFAAGKIDVLVGTQMVAKGLDFARVTLVGVVNADLQMFLPDFRAAERTFQLLTQVAGRAGRSSEFAGEVLIQTANPRHQTILSVVSGSYELFYADELQGRKEAVYPPFVRFVTIEFSGRDEAQVNEQAQHFAYYIPTQSKAFMRLGPAPPSIALLRGLYRRVIILKSSKDADPTGKILRDAIHAAQNLYNAKHPSSAVHLTINVDAGGFL